MMNGAFQNSLHKNLRTVPLRVDSPLQRYYYCHYLTAFTTLAVLTAFELITFAILVIAIFTFAILVAFNFAVSVVAARVKAARVKAVNLKATSAATATITAAVAVVAVMVSNNNVSKIHKGLSALKKTVSRFERDCPEKRQMIKEPSLCVGLLVVSRSGTY